MNVFEDVSRFLEERLDEFLQAHPHLEMQVLEDQLQEQRGQAERSMKQLQAEEDQQQQAILATAEEIQRWHERIKKAKQAKRQDLVTAAEEREAALLRQGNQQWAQMKMVKERIVQLQTLQQKIKVRQQEVKVKRREMQAQKKRPETKTQSQSSATRGWTQGTFRGGADPLEDRFRQWEMDEELEQLKRNMGR